MAKFFNTAGPCVPERHYMLPSERRISEVRPLVNAMAYFVVHAPRQTGKTTSLLAFARALTAEGGFTALLASCKTGSTAGDDIEKGVRAVVDGIHLHARVQLPEELRPEDPNAVSEVAPQARLQEYLIRWCERSPRPVVLFLDEFDALRDDPLLAVLDQLHAGYSGRPGHFPHALALIGLRDVRDYRVRRRERMERLGSSSPFNVKLKSLKIRDFHAEEVPELLEQHSAATGQSWSPAALEKVFELTQGQPWLVNALAQQVVSEEVPERTRTIDVVHVEAAKEAVILRRETHLDSLIDLLREESVRKIVEPIVAGENPAVDPISDNLEFVCDLGLVRPGRQGLEIANPIYREIVPRALTWVMEVYLPLPRPSYVTPEGRLDFDLLMDDFRAFWHEHSPSFLGTSPYPEAAAQFVYMAFVQKVVNAGGAIEREYCAGSGRVDFCIRFPLKPPSRTERWAVELKVWRDTTPYGKGIPDPVERGLLQLTEYLERLSLDKGYLLVFDMRSDAAPLPDRISREELQHEGRTIVLWRF